MASISGITTASFSYAQTDANGHVTASERYGKPYAVTDGVGRTAQFGYDVAGRVTTAPRRGARPAAAS